MTDEKLQSNTRSFDPRSAKPPARRARRGRLRAALVAGVFAVIVILGLVLVGNPLVDQTTPATTPTPATAPTPATRLTPAREPTSSAFPTGDRVLAFVDGSVVKWIRADDGDVGTFASPCPGDPCSIDGIAWSPSGSALAIGLRDWAHGMARALIVRRDGSGPRTLRGCPGGAPAWSPDGSRIAIGEDGGSEPLATCDADGGGIQVLSTRRSQMEFGPPSWSPDGRELAYSAHQIPTNDAIVVVSADGTGARRIFRARAGTRWLGAPTWSPDGRHIAFLSYPSAYSYGDPMRLWIVNADGTEPHVVLEARHIGSPVWSPDGTRLAVQSFRDQLVTDSGYLDPSATDWSLILMGADGSGQTQLMKGSGGSVPVWDPSGRALAVFVDRDLRIVPADGSPARTVAGPVDYPAGLVPLIAWAPGDATAS